MSKEKSVTKALILIQILIISLTMSCKKVIKPNHEEEYLRWIGDSKYMPETDSGEFSICNGEDNVLQYFNLGDGPVFFGEKTTLVGTFETAYKPVKNKNQDGLIRIRFIVNCQGKAGRFRVLQADSNYKETTFSKKIISQLTEITKGVEEWVILYDDNNKAVDYYYYLIFKIVDGQISEILP